MAKRLRLTVRDEAGHGRLTPARVERLIAAIVDESEAMLVTLEGPGEVFCEGLDMVGGPTMPDDEAIHALDRFAALLQAMETTSRPVVSLVDGAALGGGVGLAAAADLVLATPHATFGLPETLLGLIPATVFPVLARRVGPARARWLALGAATLSAAEAWRLGLVDEVADDLEAALARYARRLERMDARALAAVKALAAAHDSTPATYHAHARAVFQQLLGSDETRERVARFMAGHSPWPEEGGS